MKPFSETATDRPETASPEPPKGPDALEEALYRVGQAREQAVHLMAVEIDRVKLKVRKALIFAALVCLAAFAVVAILFVAIALALWGMADLIGAALGGRTWAGALILGGGILLLTSGGMWVSIAWWNRSSFNATKRRYQARQRAATSNPSVVGPPPESLDQLRRGD